MYFWFYHEQFYSDGPSSSRGCASFEFRVTVWWVGFSFWDLSRFSSVFLVSCFVTSCFTLSLSFPCWVLFYFLVLIPLTVFILRPCCYIVLSFLSWFLVPLFFILFSSRWSWLPFVLHVAALPCLCLLKTCVRLVLFTLFTLVNKALLLDTSASGSKP